MQILAPACVTYAQVGLVMRIRGGCKDDDFFRGGVASHYQAFNELSHNGVFGKPSLASAEKGERILAAAVEAIRELMESFWPDIKKLQAPTRDVPATGNAPT